MVLAWSQNFRSIGPLSDALMVLKYFWGSCFEKVKPNLGGFAIFHTPSHTKDVWKVAKLTKLGFSFSKQPLPENNIFSQCWMFFLLGSTLKYFSWGLCLKIFFCRKLPEP